MEEGGTEVNRSSVSIRLAAGLENVRQIPENIDLHVYIDETVGSGLLGAIALVTYEPVGPRVVERAMHALQEDNDPSIETDARRARGRTETLRRGHFHASADMQDAHSAFCTSIREQFQGVASMTFFAQDAPAVQRRSPAELNRLMGGLASLPLGDSVRPLHVTFERGFGVTDATAEAVLDEWFLKTEQVLHRNPAVPYYRPRTMARVAGKDEPGLQVADFVLWAFLRSQAGMKPDWFERLTATHEQDSSSAKLGITDHRYSFGPLAMLAPDARLRHLPRSIDLEAIGRAGPLPRLMRAERLVQYFARSGFPPEGAHLGERVSSLSRRLAAGPHLSREDVRACARLALALTHTCHAYSTDASDDEVQELYEMSALCSLMLDHRNGRGEALQDWYRDLRRRAWHQLPAALGLDAEGRPEV